MELFKVGTLGSIGSLKMIVVRALGEYLPHFPTAPTPWEEQFERLSAYKREYGDCLVPRKYEIDRRLGNWVHTQRRSWKANKLPADRKAKLDSIGFVFSLRRVDV